ncbi:hypothetical protein B0T21DRAFT_278159 [Apiosordaria backusii]|uniref:Tyrosyl-DNA phosphodiesterase n=1 Tax=Apiosordaria backusii TaxID=314023 RepID=A0AA40K7B4_9PEZI|nr:hypothetical protein B0T21DRAFT_278159 [Apiosordaria backusii]
MAEGKEVVDLSGSDTEDEDLRIAIALSLGQDPGHRRPKQQAQHETIDLTLDDESPAAGTDPRESRPTNESNDDKPRPSPVVISISMPTSSHPDPVPKQPSLATGLSALGLDRKKMEEERLARLAQRKRKASVEAPTAYSSLDSRSTQRPRTVGDDVSTTKGEGQALEVKVSSTSMRGSGAIGGKGNAKGKSVFSSHDRPNSIHNVSPARPSTSTPQTGMLPFPHGVVKKTWIYPSYPRVGDDIKIEEVLQKDILELAVISSFQWDEDWMLSKIDITRTKLYLVAFANSEAQEEMRNNVPKSRIRFCFPPMQAMGSMHSKLMLLKYEKYMRIVVPTGNFMSYDWGETGTMENVGFMVFMIDLPKFSNTEERDAVQGSGLTSFGEDLLYFLMAQGLDPMLINSLRNYDFSETSRYGFVHTM